MLPQEAQAEAAAALPEKAHKKGDRKAEVKEMR